MIYVYYEKSELGKILEGANYKKSKPLSLHSRGANYSWKENELDWGWHYYPLQLPPTLWPWTPLDYKFQVPAE